MVGQAIEFLATKAQAADGSYNAKAGPAVTALVTAAIVSAETAIESLANIISFPVFMS